MAQRKFRNESGSALLIAVIMTIVLAGMSAAYISLSTNKSVGTFNDKQRENAFRIAEAGLAQALLELNANRDYDGGGIGNVAVTAMTSGQFSVVMDTTGLTGNQKRLTSTGVFQTATRRIEVIVDYLSTPVTAFGMAAIVSQTPPDFSGNITVDGRDYDINDTVVVGPGTFGVTSGGAIAVGGSSGIGGNGTAPPGGGAAAGSLDPGHNWAADGVDNDQDGTIDEPGEGFPIDPDNTLGLPPNTLKNAAMATGTYFTDMPSYLAALAANGGSMPSGKIIYCEFDPSPPFRLGDPMNVMPSILVVHTAAMTGEMKNLHGKFKGLILADNIQHVNSGTQIVGMIQAWGASGNLFGNGNSTIHFSSAVLANLPSVSTNPFYIMKSWREVI